MAGIQHKYTFFPDHFSIERVDQADHSHSEAYLFKAIRNQTPDFLALLDHGGAPFFDCECEDGRIYDADSELIVERYLLVAIFSSEMPKL